MKFDIFIKRPILATMLIMFMVVLGIFAFLDIGVDLFPQVDFPVVTVKTTLLGASPEEIETEITKKVEEQINTISGLDELQSYSYEGSSFVVAQFLLEKNVDVASEEVRDRVNRVVSEFPFGTKAPIVEKFDSASSPIVQVVVSGEIPIRDLTRITRKQVKEMLETVNGVGNLNVVGGREREVHIYVDPVKLSARKLSIADVEQALALENLELPGGRLTEEPRELVVRTMGKIVDSEDFGILPVDIVDGIPVLIRDVADIKDVEQEQRTFSRFDGNPAITLIIKKQSGANTVDVIKNIKKKVEEIKTTLPSGIKIEVVQDQSRFILASIHSLEEDVVLGAILVAFTVLLFLGNFRSMIICAVSIPASIIATFSLVKWMGFTFNNLTLLALSLATGIVIDDAIIVLENIFRHIEELKEDPMTAAAKGVGEIAMAVVSTTLSLMVIFIPLALMKGIVGRFMFSFGMTMAFSIGVSLIFAFVLTPTMCARMLKLPVGEKKKESSKESGINHFLDKHYTRMLKWALGHRKVALVFASVIMFSTIPFVILVGKDFIPKDDKSEFNIHIKAPVGTSITKMNEIMKDIEGNLHEVRGVTDLLTSVGSGDNKAVNEGDIYVKMIDVEERSYTQLQVMDEVRKMLKGYPVLRTAVQEIGGPGGGSESTFQFRITGMNLEKLKIYADKMMKELRAKKGFVDVDTTFELGKPEVRIFIDRQKAADLGVRVEDVANAMQLYVSGEKDITKYKVDDELYEVRIRLSEEFRRHPVDVLSLTVPASIGDKKTPVRLDQLATIKETSGPSQIERFMRQRSIEINANLDDLPMGNAKQFVINEASEIFDEPGYKVNFVGQSKYLQEMQTNFILAFLMSFIFMYMILASLFESLIHPVTILASLPLAFPFAILSLFVTGSTLHIISILGLFLLIGIVKKNSILQVDYTNTLRAQGMERHDALVLASRTRLRPIMMTTLTLVASMIPVAIARGPGSAGRAPMAIVIIGGQSLCLFVTLVLTPVFYSVLDDVSTVYVPRWKGVIAEKFSPLVALGQVAVGYLKTLLEDLKLRFKKR